MAESSVQSAVQWLGLLFQEEGKKNLKGIQQKLEQLIDELDWMQCFLREADEARYTDLRIRRWIFQIQEIANEAEEIVGSFLYKLNSHQIQHHIGTAASLKNKLERYLWVLREAKAVHDATNDIETLRVKISTLTLRLQAYGIKITRSETGSLVSRLLRLNVIKEERIVGNLGDQVKEIVANFVRNDGRNRIVGIWGKDGVGKTNFARKVYHDQVVRKHFKRFAWINLPQNFKTTVILRELLKSLSTRTSNMVDLMMDKELVKELYDVQQAKKCLVILDGVWSSEIWDELKECFPGNGDMDSGSKILLTTHSSQVAENISNEIGCIHEMKCLTYDESLELLQTKLGGIPPHIFGNDGAHKMMEMAKKMLGLCQGIPMAIIALGGLITTRKTTENWQVLLDHMNSYLNGRGHQQPYEKVIELCYYNLPYYLKNCLLHLGSFPKDFEIPVNKLCQLWIAEGFITLRNGEVALEELSEHCLSELLQRGMIQVAKRGYDGKIKSCCLHDLMRNLCLKACKEENFLTIIDSDSYLLDGKARRLALYIGEEEEISLPQRNPLLRSLLLFYSQKERSQLHYASLKALCRDSELLRVLDLEGSVMSSNTLPKEIGDLIYLRFLSLKDMLLTKLLPSIGNLRWLETLDLRVKLRLELPNIFSRLERLRNLYLPQNFIVKDSEKLRLDALKNLLVLKNADHFRVGDVLGLKNIRKASVKFMPENEHIEFIKRSPKVLFSLIIFKASITKDHVNVLQSFSNLIQLNLRGVVPAPINTLAVPPTLKKLLLDFCGIQQDPMPVFEKLPVLKSLCFDHQAFMGRKMVCSSSGFPKLIYLRLNGLKNLEEWNVENGSMPNLLHLEIKGCERLAKIPNELPQQVHITLA